MKDEYDFKGGKRGLFYRPDEEKRFVITLDHRPLQGEFEIYVDPEGTYRYKLTKPNGELVLENGPFDSRESALDSIDALREVVIGAETVETS